MLATLQSHGYFERHAGSASGRIRKYSVIEVRLTNRHRRVLWVETPPVFEALLEHTEAYGLSPFHPREGFLTASRRFTALSMDEPEQWPDVFGFSLRELDSGGRWVSGAALAYVWPLVNERGVPTVVREGESVRALGLQIPGVSAVEPPRDCWETGYSP